MTSAELKNLLDLSAAALDAGEKVYSVQANQNIIKVLENSNDASIAVLAALLKIPVEELKANMGELVKYLTTTQTLFTTDQAAKLSGICKNLSSKPLVLAIISKFI